jgi:hypothetical protein
MTPSGENNTNAANFYASVTNYASPPSPLYQSLIGSSEQRTNVLENFFILSRGNQNGVPTWFGVGYAVTTNAPPGSLYSLYRFATNHPVASIDPAQIFINDFGNFLTNISGGSHLMDGVVYLTARAYDTNGVWMNYSYTNSSGFITNSLSSQFGESGFEMFNHTLPATVEIEMGVLEDRTLQRAESLGASFSVQTNYLAQQAGKVHIFRQRVSIPNVDPAGYQ